MLYFLPSITFWTKWLVVDPMVGNMLTDPAVDAKIFIPFTLSNAQHATGAIIVVHPHGFVLMSILNLASRATNILCKTWQAKWTIASQYNGAAITDTIPESIWRSKMIQELIRGKNLRAVAVQLMLMSWLTPQASKMMWPVYVLSNDGIGFQGMA